MLDIIGPAGPLMYPDQISRNKPKVDKLIIFSPPGLASSRYTAFVRPVPFRSVPFHSGYYNLPFR